ncbi:Oidioi.mRNA.OKI2018_I69.YSR.g17167.t1.cds [Oikopleura dioica]|uniref:Oidioi.mRNA.OKI2018_I69.YSR.g17167.t1.cds n=1 Tax=Oikopleura dioica TaxID=34765 RepID=A0ABN7SNG6_OIKDI|nr:Oidioi.mRNA.OKI2018_I69.YSR.g17167.t1.cds [Oikopleura dioica]
MTSDGEKEWFLRKDLNYESGIIMAAKFVKYLSKLRQRAAEKLPPCLQQGIDMYSYQLSKDAKDQFTPEEQGVIRKKLNYLKEFFKLKCYAWNGESYDLRILMPLLTSVLYDFVGRKSNQLNIIKRDGGYMMLECAGISFRDFMNHVGPISLEKFARSFNLDPAAFSKGIFPYDLFTDMETMYQTTQLPPYPAFSSSLYIPCKDHALEMNSIIKSKFESGEWTQLNFFEKLDEYLGLERLYDSPALKDLPPDCPPTMIQYIYSHFEWKGDCYECDAENEAVKKNVSHFAQSLQ